MDYDNEQYSPPRTPYANAKDDANDFASKLMIALEALQAATTVDSSLHRLEKTYKIDLRRRIASIPSTPSTIATIQSSPSSSTSSVSLSPVATEDGSPGRSYSVTSTEPTDQSNSTTPADLRNMTRQISIAPESMTLNLEIPTNVLDGNNSAAAAFQSKKRKLESHGSDDAINGRKKRAQ